ncbi:uncharacterized protein K441DRAFT_705706 [Cenococcum geophilum 1.58]|uniref:uncharacterized protein n=1 Tax=Cenococcum geophilum 1.58 TaxID=794803 RepID=UPI00358FF15B|nr:hypothetical protein K441DRAFT_705706 [Cenococcum geophilum 1.58]
MESSNITHHDSQNIPNDAAPSYQVAIQESVTPWVSNRVLEKPVVVPQTTNIFHIKSISPFARAYAPALSQLPNPITQEEFLAFIDRLNNAFLAQPILVASTMAGGALMGTQILPVQLAGGAVQAVSALTSASISFVRVRKLISEANATMFGPRGLQANIMTTKKMTAAIGMNGIAELGDDRASVDGQLGDQPEDPRMRRIHALDGYCSPLSFDVPEQPLPDNTLKRIATAPTRWQSNLQKKSLIRARKKGLKKYNEQIEEVHKDSSNMRALEQRIEVLRERADQGGLSTEEDCELHRLEIEFAIEFIERDRKVDVIRQSPDKKMEKISKKETKTANRILWLVILRN